MTYPSYGICMVVAVRGPITLYIRARRPIVEPLPASGGRCMRMVQVNPDELPANQTVDIRDQMDMVWRHKWLILFFILVLTGLAAAYSYTRVPQYNATATVLVRPILTNPLETNPIEQVSVQTELRIATSAAVGQVAAAKLGMPRSQVPELLDHVSVSSPEETQILEISFAASGRKTAQEAAQAFAEAYLEFKSNQAIQTISEYTGSLQTRIQDGQPRSAR